MPDAKKVRAGKAGGTARAKSLSKAAKTRIAKKGAKALWLKIHAWKTAAENNLK